MGNYKEKKLWDLVVRIFHWSLVVLVLIAFISSEEGEGIHIKVGFAILGIVLFRIVWGFIGSKHARFTDFVKGPRKVIAYLKGLFTGSPPYSFGHNPAGGAMIVLILITLLLVAFTGIKTEEGERAEHASISEFSIVSIAYADDEHFESGRGYDSDYGDHDEGENAAHASHEFWEELHELFAGFLLVLIAVHVAAVFLTLFVYKENLIKSMITGRKAVRYPGG